MAGLPSRLGFAVALAWWATSCAQEAGEYCVDDAFASPKTTALNCSFRDRAPGPGVTVWCDELSRALDYAPFISFPFYLHTRYELVGVEGEAAADDDGGLTTTLCLGLRKVTTRRVSLEEPWKNVSITFMEPFKVFMLIGAKQMILETSYNESVPVGYASLDAECMTNRTSGLCVKEVRVAQQLMRPVYDTNPYLPSYWEEVQEVRTDILGEHGGRLLVDFQRDYNLSADVYVAPFVRGTYQLEQLRVTGVDLSRLGRYLGSLPHLRRLDLSEDNLEAMAPEIFLNVSNVMELNLASNHLKNVSEGISYLKNLTSLDLSWNPLNTSDAGVKDLVKVLKTLHSLQWLFLAGINFGDLDALRPLLGRGGTKLLGLDLSFCGLTSLSGEGAEEIFEAQTDLRVLRLSGNKLGEVHPRVFLPLHHLKELNLSSCGLTDGPELQISPHTTLAVLDMSHNNLSLAKSVVSSGCVSSLDLSNNSIRSWSDVDAFAPSCWPNVSDEASAVVSLNLSHNLISTLSPEMMASLGRLSSVDLGGNRIDCSLCTTPALQAWLRSAARSGRPRVLAGGHDAAPLACSAPVDRFGAPVSEAAFDSAACEPASELVDYGLVFGVPLTALAAFVTCVFVVLYVYRFELTYLMHLVKMKRRRTMATHYASQNYLYDAFVCYSGSDRAWVVGKLLPRMERQPTNYRMCLHERDFVLGSFITSNIVTSMQNSRFTIVVLSNSFVQSQWCRWELEMANHKLLEDDSDFLVLLELERLAQDTVPRHLKYLMDTRTYLEWPDEAAGSDQEEQLWKRLETALGPSLANSRMLPSAAKPRIPASEDARPAPAV